MVCHGLANDKLLLATGEMKDNETVALAIKSHQYLAGVGKERGIDIILSNVSKKVTCRSLRDDRAVLEAEIATLKPKYMAFHSAYGIVGIMALNNITNSSVEAVGLLDATFDGIPINLNQIIGMDPNCSSPRDGPSQQLCCFGKERGRTSCQKIPRRADIQQPVV